MAYSNGRSVKRFEDLRLITGQGAYTADLEPQGAARLFLLRTPHAHAVIKGINCTAARAMAGVLAIYTADDLRALGDLPCVDAMTGADGQECIMPSWPLLARARVRYVGEAVAACVAHTLAQAQDAAEQIVVDYEPCAHVVSATQALTPKAPTIWPQAPGNLCLNWEIGEQEKVDECLKTAAHRVRRRIVNNRLVACSLEPRTAFALYHEDQLELHVSCQGVHGLQGILSEALHIPKESLRVRCRDVGGGFGMKLAAYGEYALVLEAARRLKRPVAWVSERQEAFVSDTQGRDHETIAELGLDDDGKFIALKVETVANMGAYTSTGAPPVPTVLYGRMMAGIYTFDAVFCRVRCAFTNTTPVDAYRGAGRPEASYVIERMVDEAARQIDLSPHEIRRRNFIPENAFPYDTKLGLIYDSGAPEAIMERAMQEADWAGFIARKAAARSQGMLRGLGMASYVEACSAFGDEYARLTLDADGGLTFAVGTQSNGQGHATAYAQLLSEHLEVPASKIRLEQGDSAALPGGGGTGGSRSLLMGGLVGRRAADGLITQARAFAAEQLEARAEDILFAQGQFAVSGTDRGLSWRQIAEAAQAHNLTLAQDAYEKKGTLTYPSGCHICEVEIDPETGLCTVISYTGVDDFGRIINPMLVAGQVQGGITQGIGQALHEHTVYDEESGQLLSASLMDYCLPRCANLPAIAVCFDETRPCASNPFGLKGAGEAGAIASPPAVMNAVMNALSSLGPGLEVQMPATPEEIWKAVQRARG